VPIRERSILLLHPSDEAYGADRALLRAAVGLRDRGWRVRLLLADDQPPGWVTEQARAAGIPLSRGPLAPARRRYTKPGQLLAYLRQLLEARRRIRREIDSFQPSVVLVNTSALLVGGILGRPRGVRLVWYVHEIVVDPPLASWLFRLVPLISGDLVLAVSKAARRHLTPFGLGRSKVVVLWNAIDPRPIRPKPRRGPPLVAFVGRLNRWKGYEVLVEAAALLADERPEVRFAIVGDPPSGEEWRTEALRQEVERLGLTDRFELPGFVADGRAIFERATIAVVPSTWPEPCGGVILEAMWAGTPVIATAHGGSPEILEDGDSGVLIPPRDAYALAGAIRRLLSDAPLRERIAVAGQHRAHEVFSSERSQERLNQILTGFLDRDRTAAPEADLLPQ
jgi:glycosyltransferase involved in cell wall biosynthesis